MAFGANSRIFRTFMEQVLANLAAINLGTTAADTPKCALFGNTSTPNQDDTLAHNTYSGAGGAWVQANEVIDSVGPGTNWATAGRALSTIASHFTSDAGIVWYDAADTNGAGNVTISGAYGCMVYDDTVSDIGMTFHSFGGSQGVTAGTFCADAATEILTRRGWLRHDQVRAGDECLTLNVATGGEEWQRVQAVHVFAEGPYDVIRLDGPGHSSVTTPDHRWPAETPGEGIGWYTTATLPRDAQVIVSGTERTGKVKDLTATEETADLVWCVQTPNQTWMARRDNSHYVTGNTVVWDTWGIFKITLS